MRRIGLIGLGPHSKRIYYPFLEKYQEEFGIELSFLVELEDQRSKVENYTQTRKPKPREIIFLSNAERTGDILSSSIEKRLDIIHGNTPLYGIIIATEPKAHRKYIKNDIYILMDKPITAPANLVIDQNAAQKLFDDFLQIKQQLRKSKSKLEVQCQRRYHKGYQYVHNLVKKLVGEYGVPLTYMDIYHADGMWNMPTEFLFRENHPYKYGYGKLMHSGYHFVDLYCWFHKINSILENKKPNNLEIYAKSYRPKDFIFDLDKDFYSKFLPDEAISEFFSKNDDQVDRFGEIDVYTKLQSKRDQKVVNTTSLDLQQNSFSRRAWAELPEDTYKGNGRVRHERFNIQISHLANIQVHSYQSYEVKKNDVVTTGVGAEDHFDIYIFRNSELIGGETLEKIKLGEELKEMNAKDGSFIGHNEKAREDCFLDFITSKESKSNFLDHEFTNLVLSEIYKCLTLEYIDDISISKLDISNY